jgi:hypothetical protein
MEWRSIFRRRMDEVLATFFPLRKFERVLIRARVVKRCRRSREKVFSTFRNRVRRRPAITLWQVAGRLTTRFTGDSH